MITSDKLNFWKKKFPTARRELKTFLRFINRNRGWLCLEECKVGPECDFCVLIFQINYSYSCNKKADITTFRNSVMGQTFDRLYEIYQDYKLEKNGQAMKIIGLRKIGLKKIVIVIVSVIVNVCN